MSDSVWIIEFRGALWPQDTWNVVLQIPSTSEAEVQHRISNLSIRQVGEYRAVEYVRKERGE